MPPNEVPSPEPAEPKTAGHGNIEKRFTAYSVVNPAFTHASAAFLEAQGLASEFAKGRSLNQDQILSRSKETRYPQTVLNWLEAQSFLDFSPQGGEYKPSEAGKQLFHRADQSRLLVERYSGIANIVKSETGLEIAELRDTFNHLFADIVVDADIKRGTLLPAAITYAHEAEVKEGPHYGRNAGSLLTEGTALNADQIRYYIAATNRQRFLETLQKSGLLEIEAEGDLWANRNGKKALKLGGYAELALSYYPMLQKLDSLARKTDSYGLDGTVKRDPELNARASNGILNQRVAPHIVNSLTQNPLLKEVLESGYDPHGGYIDYGSGGADMLIQVAEDKTNQAKALYGVEINEKTNALARELVDKKRLHRPVDLITGSIVDPITMVRLKEHMDSLGVRGAVASINFILHDICPEMSAEFLKLHSLYFPKVPLIITETFKVPKSVLRAHPDYQAASFYFMHDASGQHLYTEEELEALLRGNGYEILSRQTHSTIPNEDNTEQLPYIATWVTRPQAC